MIDFSTLKSLSIPEGVVTKIEDSIGNILWQLKKPAKDNTAILGEAVLGAMVLGEGG